MRSGVSDEEDIRAVHRVLSGDTAAFRPLVAKYGDRMLSFCRSRTATEEDAADAAQDTFIRAFRSLKSFRLGASFAAWLFAIAANRARSAWGRRLLERDKASRAESAERAAAAPDPEMEALRSLEAESVRAAVGGLPADLRIVVELYYFAELSIDETAAAAGLGAEAVKSRLFRARKKLRTELEYCNRNGAGGVL